MVKTSSSRHWEVMLDANFPVMYFSLFPFSKNCWYNSVFPHNGVLDGNTVGPSLLYWNPPPSCFCFVSKNCSYTSSFPLNGGLDGNTVGPSLLSSEAPSRGEITSVPTISPGTFMEVSLPSSDFDSGLLGFFIPILGSSRYLDWPLHSHQYYNVKIDFQLAHFHP